MNNRKPSPNHPQARAKWWRNAKLRAVAMAGGKCMDCNFDFDGRPECADFDHRDGRTAEEKGQRLTNGHLYHRGVHLVSLVKLPEVLSRCDLVCANCHRTRTRTRLLERVGVDNERLD